MPRKSHLTARAAALCGIRRRWSRSNCCCRKACRAPRRRPPSCGSLVEILARQLFEQGVAEREFDAEIDLAAAIRQRAELPLVIEIAHRPIDVVHLDRRSAGS
jgi:hypothetical protein